MIDVPLSPTQPYALLTQQSGTAMLKHFASRHPDDPEAAAIEYLRTHGFTVVNPDPTPDPMDSAIVKRFSDILSKNGGDIFAKLSPMVADAIQELVFQSYDRSGVKPDFKGGQRRMIFLETLREFIADRDKYDLTAEEVLLVRMVDPLILNCIN